MNKFYKLPQELAARKDLTGNAKIVLAVISNYQGGNDHAWPGIRALMRDAGVESHTVQNAIGQLESAGLLEVIRRGNGKVSHYKTVAETATPTVAETATLTTPTVAETATPTVAETATQPLQKLLHNKNNKNHNDKTYILQFEKSRKNYPGSKRGLKTEFANFKKKHHDWKQVVSLLTPAVESQKKRLWTGRNKKYIPHFQTWINNRQWELEISERQQNGSSKINRVFAESSKFGVTVQM